LDKHKRILLVGFGNMGQALARGWLAKGHSRDAIRVIDPDARALESAAGLGLQASARVADLPSAWQPAVVLLAVKPNQLAAALGACRPLAGVGTVFLSIAAGKTLAQVAELLGASAAVVRAMPNTPAAVGKGITALVANPAVAPAERTLCSELMAAVGAVAWLDDERHMDAVTAVSGSGPAYVFLLIECLERAALDVGLAPELAKQLALATVAGAGAYAEAAAEPAAELRRRVTSPGGTTQAALEVLMSEHGLDELLRRAVQAAAARSRELSAV
jgi:pyrroline-5-carboxylate reductase